MEGAGQQCEAAQDRSVFKNWFSNGSALIHYRQAKACLVCQKPRCLFVSDHGAVICFLCYEAMGFTLK